FPAGLDQLGDRLEYLQRAMLRVGAAVLKPHLTQQPATPNCKHDLPLRASIAYSFAFVSANWPRSVFWNRDSLPLVAISLIMAASSGDQGVGPPGAFQ